MRLKSPPMTGMAAATDFGRYALLQPAQPGFAESLLFVSLAIDRASMPQVWFPAWQTGTLRDNGLFSTRTRELPRSAAQRVTHNRPRKTPAFGDRLRKTGYAGVRRKVAGTMSLRPFRVPTKTAPTPTSRGGRPNWTWPTRAADRFSAEPSEQRQPCQTNPRRGGRCPASGTDHRPCSVGAEDLVRKRRRRRNQHRFRLQCPRSGGDGARAGAAAVLA
jgi:hypothetical protein